MITCPKCSKENQDHYKFCLGCGAELPREHAPKPFSPQTPPQGVPAAVPAASRRAAPVAPAASARGMGPPRQPPLPRSHARSSARADAGTGADGSSCGAAPVRSTAGSRRCPQCGHRIPAEQSLLRVVRLQPRRSAPAGARAGCSARRGSGHGAAFGCTALRADGSEAGTYRMPDAQR